MLRTIRLPSSTTIDQRSGNLHFESRIITDQIKRKKNTLTYLIQK